MEESRSILTLGNEDTANTRRGAEPRGTNAMQRIAGGREGGIQTRCASEEENWSEEVNRQCHSGNRTKYIYINSLLYNHDKQKTHSHKNINLK